MNSFFHNFKNDMWNFKYFPVYFLSVLCINLFFIGTGPIVERINIGRIIFISIIIFIGVCIYIFMHNASNKFSSDIDDKIIYISYAKRNIYLISGAIFLVLGFVETLCNFTPYKSELHYLIISTCSVLGTIFIMSAFNQPVEKKENIKTDIDNNDEDTIHKEFIIRKRRKVILVIFLIGTFALIISGLIKIIFTGSYIEGIIQIITSILANVYMFYFLKIKSRKQNSK